MRHHGSALISLSVRIRRPSLPKAFRTALLLAALPLNTSIAFAQGAGNANTPVTQEQIFRMVQLATLNMCVLAKEKVAYKTSMQANMYPMVAYVVEIHGSKIKGVNDDKALPAQQIEIGLQLQLLMNVGKNCPKDLPEAYKKEVTRAETAIKSQAGG